MPIKSDDPKIKRVNYKAELKDAFMVIGYDVNKAFTELDWTICPDGKCPTVRTYKWGTQEFLHLDSVIYAAKFNRRKL